jgi:protein SCO1
MSVIPVRTALATVAVALAGAVAFAQLTHGFTALTTETARRAAVELAPVTVPDLIGKDHLGRARELLADLDHAGRVPRVTIVDFIYTRCESLCSALGSTYQQLQADIRARGLQDKVRLLTVSFDPLHDTPAMLAQYALRMHADPGIWTLMSPTRPEQLAHVLTAFGVVVVPVPPDQLQHNAAFHVIDTRGRLVRIVDVDDPQAALDEALSIGRIRESLT